MTDYQEILRLSSQGISQRSIAQLCGCSRNTVSSTLKRAKAINLEYPFPEELSDTKLRELLFPKVEYNTDRLMPDYEYIHKELSKPSVTMKLLWLEYCDQCSLSKQLPFMYSQFCKYYREFAKTNKATMHITRKPGELLEVDWAGKTAQIVNGATGEITKAYVFVATLSSSKYSYVEAFLSMKLESWITGHVNAYQYFGGSTKTVVPDNLKAGVTKADKYDPILNKTYNEMAKHYNTVIMPARVKKPKDKPSVEGEVGVISTAIIAALRNHKFFSLSELNEAIQMKLNEHNIAPFQKRSGSRLSAFKEEKEFLIPLPTQPFEMAEWKVATVAFNYHIQVDKMNYSVPYEYIKQKVDVRMTNTTVEVFYKNLRIASHPRLRGMPYKYHTNKEHMPEAHKAYVAWDSARFLKWANSVGPNTRNVIQGILDSYEIEQQGYKTCMGILKLADTYSLTRLEAACEKALVITHCPSCKHIRLILQNSQDKVQNEDINEPSESNPKAGFTRGSSYYGGSS